MDRNRVFELAREVWSAAGGTVYIGPSISQVEEFAYLVERELRGDAEPVAWLSRDKARVALWEAINKRSFGNPTDDKLILEHLRQNGLWIGKYNHPAPAVDAEPVAWLIKQETPTEDCLVRHPRVSDIVGDYNRAEAHCDIGKPIPLYTHPTHAVDAKPVAFEFQHEDTGLIDFVDPQQVEWGFQKNNPRWQLIGPVFRHPAPAVVRQLVDGLAGLIDFIEIDNLKIDQDALRIAKAALAAVKGVQL